MSPPRGGFFHEEQATAVSAWSTTAISNATTLGIDIGEGCDAANINNAIRELMPEAKTKFDSVDRAIPRAKFQVDL